MIELVRADLSSKCIEQYELFTLYITLEQAMVQQLSLDLDSSDTKNLSLLETSSDAQIEAIERFCYSRNNEAIACVNKYSPGRRKVEYYRLSWNQGNKKKHIHIPGGNVNSQLAQYRAKKLQQMCARGAELGELIAAVKTYRGGK